MTDLSVYLAQDRLRALASNTPLPDRTRGCVLFADISGFTPLTEKVRRVLGTRLGAETVAHHLSRVYGALIDPVACYGGSVVTFAGDSITCWFDEARGRAAARAATCALHMQSAIRPFRALALPDGDRAELALKVALATGPVRRFMVGDPDLQRRDTLAGGTLARAVLGERLSAGGEVLLDAPTWAALGSLARVAGRRTDARTGQRFGVLAELDGQVAPRPWPPLPANTLAPEQLRPYVLPAVYERASSGQGTFLTEFRPCVALFAYFPGIDYDGPQAEVRLDAFVRLVQAIADRYGGTLLDLTIGDKGSFLYVNFGALVAHEDDARRAIKAALALRDFAQQLGYLAPLQCGLAQGIMRVGAYGSPTRRVYGAVSDDVNLAARLMEAAAPGEILVSGRVQAESGGHFSFAPGQAGLTPLHFDFAPRPALHLRGKTAPVSAFAVTAARRRPALHLPEPDYPLPMVGRQAELEAIAHKLDLALQNRAQVVGVVAEAGIGKSRLVAEGIRLAQHKGFVGYGGACQSDGVHTPYLAWRPIWRAFFDLDPSAPIQQQARALERRLAALAPQRLPAAPLLNAVLNLDLPDNDFTRTLEPRSRKSALHALLEDALRAATADEPILIVMEDGHWVDALSHDLLLDLARALTDCPICFLLAYRPPRLLRLQTPRVEALPHFTKIELHELTPAESRQVIRAKLAQRYPELGESGEPGDELPPPLLDALVARAEGNPFFLEELLNYLHDRRLDPRDPATLAQVELPDSLHTLILSRIDQLTASEKATLRVASIIGRLFRASWLIGYYPALGPWRQVKADLDELSVLDITPLDSPEPELTYIFKHIVTHQVTYQSLPFALRARLHEQLAHYLEQQIAAGVLAESSLLDTLVHHYRHSDNRDREGAYLQKAARAALAVSAFDTAVDYTARLLEITPEADPAYPALALQLAGAHYGLSHVPAARAAVDRALAAAHTASDRVAALAFLGEMTSEMGDYAAAQAILAEAVPLARTAGDDLALSHALYVLGDVHWRLGDLDEARAALDESLALARALGDLSRELFALNRLAVVSGQQGDLDAKERLLHQVRERALAAGNRERAMVAFNNLGVVAFERWDGDAARNYYRQALDLARAIGAQMSIAFYLINLANADICFGQPSDARPKLREGLALALRHGVQPRAVTAVKNFAQLAFEEGQPDRALALMGLARRHPAWSSDHQRDLEATLAYWALDPAQVEEGLARGAELDWDATVRALLAPDPKTSPKALAMTSRTQNLPEHD